MDVAVVRLGYTLTLKKKNMFISYRQMLTNQEFNNTWALGWPHYSFYLLQYSILQYSSTDTLLFSTIRNKAF